MIRRLLHRLHQFWFDGAGDCLGHDDEVRAYRAVRMLVARLGLAEDPRIQREFDEMERENRALRRERQRR